MFPRAPAITMARVRIRPVWALMTDELAHIENDAPHSQYAEKGEQNLTPAPWQAHAKGHTVVLNEMKNPPVTQNGNLLVKGHVGFDQNF